MALLVASGCACQIGHPGHQIEDEAVLQMTDEAGEGFCTAFHLGHGLWATAKHCTTWTGGAVLVRGQPLTLLESMEKHDVAFYRGPTTYPSLRLGAMPGFGDPVHTVGYGWHGSEYHHLFMHGYWGDQEESEGLWEFSVMVDGGASGSPVMDADGYVVGVLVAGYRGRPYTYAVGVSDFRVMAQSLLSHM